MHNRLGCSRVPNLNSSEFSIIWLKDVCDKLLIIQNSLPRLSYFLSGTISMGLTLRSPFLEISMFTTAIGSLQLLLILLVNKPSVCPNNLEQLIKHRTFIPDCLCLRSAKHLLLLAYSQSFHLCYQYYLSLGLLRP